jgi:hypothetical protein
VHLQLRLIVHEFGAFFVFERFVRVAFSTSDFALAFFRFFFQLRKEYLINNIVVRLSNWKSLQDYRLMRQKAN